MNSGDKGACYAPTDVGALIKMTHYGFHVNQRLQGKPVIDPLPPDKIDGCHSPARDVVTAPYNDVGFRDARAVYTEVGGISLFYLTRRLHFNPALPCAVQILKNNGESPQRTNLFFFAGGVRENSPYYR